MLCSAQAAQFEVSGCSESNQNKKREEALVRGAAHEGGEAQQAPPSLSCSCEHLCLTCWVLFKAGGSPPVCSERTRISSMDTPLAKQEVEFGISWVFLGL